MCRNIASFMIGMNGHIQTHQFFKGLIFVTHHVRKITGPIQQAIWLNMFIVLILPAVNVCGNTRQSRPSLGSWVLYGLGTENQNMPGYVSLRPGGPPPGGSANWQSSFLPGVYQGVSIKVHSVTYLDLPEMRCRCIRPQDLPPCGRAELHRAAVGSKRGGDPHHGGGAYGTDEGRFALQVEANG